MADKARRGAGAAIGLGLTLAGALVPHGLAQETARPPLACEAPAGSLARPAPLPHVAAALKSSDKLNILIIGSPIGLEKSERKSYPAALESILENALTGVDVVIANRPVSGEIAATAVERMRTEVALARPDLLIWQVGANDALQHVNPADYEQNLRDGVRWAEANNFDVLLVGFEANPWLHDKAEADAIREATRRVAEAENVLYLRRNEAMQFLEKTRKSVEAGENPFSPEIGYECLAEQVAQALVANMVLRRTRPLEHNP
ncbi:MAG TPA: GDSL-type esterase/lipase family protein [Rhodoblastus sp.]|nr:GDSL-type esterase/lipase family protein [Rhodoblastus sp.]